MLCSDACGGPWRTLTRPSSPGGSRWGRKVGENRVRTPRRQGALPERFAARLLRAESASSVQTTRCPTPATRLSGARRAQAPESGGHAGPGEQARGTGRSSLLEHAHSVWGAQVTEAGPRGRVIHPKSSCRSEDRRGPAPATSPAQGPQRHGRRGTRPSPPPGASPPSSPQGPRVAGQRTARGLARRLQGGGLFCGHEASRTKCGRVSRSLQPPGSQNGSRQPPLCGGPRRAAEGWRPRTALRAGTWER